MESRSTRPPPPLHEPPRCPDELDRITALSDDMLFEVLARLRCTRAAARTSLLSRRWRVLWAGLPSLIFRDAPAGVVEAALSHVTLPATVSLLDVRLAESTSPELDDARAKSLLDAIAEKLSPEDLVFILPQTLRPGGPVTIELPTFGRATSIDLDTCFLCIKPPMAGELPALETLSVSGNIVDLAALLDRCPRLRVLGVTFRHVHPETLDSGLAALEAAKDTLGLEYDYSGYTMFDRPYVSYNFFIAARLVSLLRTATRLSPEELLFNNFFCEGITVDLPCFHATRSIDMSLCSVRFTQLPDNRTTVDLQALLARCPRLRVLKVSANVSTPDVRVSSGSLLELYIYVDRVENCRGIDIITPLLKRLKLAVHGNAEINMRISAPMMEKASLCWSYTGSALLFGFWSLSTLSLETAESYKDEQGVLTDGREDACLPLQHIHVLSLHVSTNDKVCLLSVRPLFYTTYHAG
jgi:hypothetical protein